MAAIEKRHTECPYCGNTRFEEKIFRVLRRESPTMFWSYEQPKSVRASAVNEEYHYFCTKCGEELDRYAVSQGLPVKKIEDILDEDILKESEEKDTLEE